MMHPATTSQVETNVSTTFFPSAILPGTFGDDPDIVLCSSDQSFFHVHSSVLRAKSLNSFGHNLPSSSQGHKFYPPSSRTSYVYYPGWCSSSTLATSPASLFKSSLSSANPTSQAISSIWRSRDDVCAQSTSLETQLDINRLYGAVPFESPGPLGIQVEETSTVLNLVLHIIYGMSFFRFPPDIDAIGSALDSLRRYGIPIPTDPAAEIWSTLLRQAHLDPIQAYTIAASHDASSVCVLASEHTLSRSLDSVSEADALRMGPIYLRLLFRLHIGRNQALGRVIKTPPKEHLPSKTCSISAQRFVMSAWSLTVASVMSGARVHNTSAIELREAFGPLMQKNTCELCKDNAPARISEMIRAWLAIRRTI